MTSRPDPGDDRLLELLADEAVQGLSAAERAEMEALLRAAGKADRDGLALAAASLDLAFAQEAGALEPSMPPALAAKIAAQAPITPASRGSGTAVAGRIGPDPARESSGGAFTGLAWLAAAACLALAAAGWWSRPGPAPAAPDPSRARASLLATAPDIKQWKWAALGELEGEQVAGDVVWSTRRQAGYMTFSGLRPNDPQREQYQLWIFDPAQSDKTPIDGGVFDVADASGTVVVPIDPKLRVSDAVLFAVTIEKPGGVVVSDRSRLVLIAKAD